MGQPFLHGISKSTISKKSVWMFLIQINLLGSPLTYNISADGLSCFLKNRNALIW
jgi:hypothetical protein